MKLLVMQLSPPSHHSIPFWSKYSPQRPKIYLGKSELGNAAADMCLSRIATSKLTAMTSLLADSAGL
jgi:hypothetical protein